MKRDNQWLRISLLVTLMYVVGTFFTGCGANPPATETGGQSHEDEHGKAPHGGEIITVGDDVLHLELVHDAEAGKITIYVYDGEVKNPLTLAKAPVINLTTPDGDKQLAVTGSGSQFAASDPALKIEPLAGRISLEYDGKPYQVSLADEHQHHEEHGHK